MPDADEAELVAEVRADYEARAEKRRETEAGWRLNMRFVSGDQYCYRSGESVFDIEPEYPWQERQTFNHIASIVETRLAKLSRVRPVMSVRPASGDNDDVKAARTSGKILDSASVRLDLPGLLSRGTMWSEICGTAFYKLVWDGDAADGAGDVYAEVCPPFEIYPESLSAEDVTDLKSVIHARAVHVDDILAAYGKSVPPEPPETLLSLADAPVGCATVIERYTCPDAQHPDGELAVVAGGELLYRGPLPDGLPFVRQVSIARPGRFFGTSMVERTKIERHNGKIVYEDEKGDLFPLAEDTLVSMNMFGFTPDYFKYSKDYFSAYLKENIGNPKSEFYIPTMVNKLIKDGRVQLRVLHSSAQWFGVTYKEDRPAVVERIRRQIEAGIYPEKLWK